MNLSRVESKSVEMYKRKLSLYRAVEAHKVETSRLLHFLDNRLTYGGEVVSLTLRAGSPLPPGKFLVLISVNG
jgi:hypothetical protein